MKCLTAFLCLVLCTGVTAQVKIGDNPTTINSNSLLELETTNKGFVLPRVSLTSTLQSSPLSSSMLEGTIVYNTNSAVTGGSGVGLYFWTGTQWYFLSTPSSINAWSLAGNSISNSSTNFIGTTNATSLSFRTNNIRRMLLDSLTGNLAIGASTFDANNPEKLLVDAGTTTSHTVANFKGSVNDYFQINIQNTSNGTNASSDFVATADNGTDSTYYVDFGINGSNFAPSVENFGGQNDGYLYSNARNLLIGTQASGSDLIFLVAGNSIAGNTAMRISGTNGNIILGRGDNGTAPTGNTLRGPNASTSGNINGGTVTLQGGKGNGTGSGGSINITGGSTGTGTVGSVNINASNNFPTNINTGTTTQNLTMGGLANNILLPKYSTVGRIFYTSLATGQISTSANMYWDSINNRLGVGTASPATSLHVNGIAGLGFASSTAGQLRFYNASNANTATISSGVTTSSYTLTMPTAPPTADGQVLSSTTGGTMSWTTVSGGGGGSGWSLTGNSITSGQYLGTTNAQALVLKANSTQMGYFDGNLGSLTLGVGAVNNSSDHNVAIGYNASTNNQYTLALGYNASASGVRSIAIGNGASATTASGAESIAMGYNATASNVQTTAIGYQAQATGQYGIAIGFGAQANTNAQTTAIGYQALANQQYATALGYQAQATGTQSTAIGYGAQTSQSNTILLGNTGTSTLAVGIGTATPSAKLHILASSGMNPLVMQGLPSGNLNTDYLLTINNTTGVVGSVTPTTISSTFWGLSGNAATNTSFLGTTNNVALQFKYNSTLAGYLDGNNTAYGTSSSGTSGSNNTAIGYSSTAQNSATAIGANATANSSNNIAIGNSARANGSSEETAIGSSSTANAQYNTAIGYNTQAISNSQATAIGSSATANAFQATALGYSAQAISNSQTTAVGASAQANAQYNLAVGYNAQANSNSKATAIGSNASATGNNSTAIGYNAQTSQANALILGDASATVNVGIGTSTPNTATKLDVNGSFKLGAAGTAIKNMVSGSGSLSVTVPAASTISVVGVGLVINGASGSADGTITLSSSLTSTQAAVTVSPAFDLPAGVAIASARMSANNTVKIRFINTGASSQTVSGTFYIVAKEF